VQTTDECDDDRGETVPGRYRRQQLPDRSGDLADAGEPGKAAGDHESDQGHPRLAETGKGTGAGRLAGLGGGLTPAGDDFVLGVLLAAYMAAAPGERWRSALLGLLGFATAALGALVVGRADLAYGVPSLAAVAFVAGQVASEQRAASERRDELARRDARIAAAVVAPPTASR